MGEFVNSIGKIRGKYGNVIAYVGANGKNYCKGAELTRKPARESQKQHSIAFGAVTREKRSFAKAIRLGFPGGNGYPKGGNGFTSVNVPDAVSVEKLNPDKPVSPRKRAADEFLGVIDYGKLRVAAGSLVTPVVSVEVDAENRTISFHHEKCLIDAIDCFLDDRIYGVVLPAPQRGCHVVELGARGETTDKCIDFPEYTCVEKLVIYVFATTASGKNTSFSTCLREPSDRK